MATIRPFQRKFVVRVYSGKPGCMCGCNGKYFYPSTVDQEAATKVRGYSVDDEISDSQVTRVVNKIHEHLDRAEVLPGEYIAVQVNQRDYFAFFNL